MTFCAFVFQTGGEGGEVFKNLSEHGLTSPQATECGGLLTLMLKECWPQSQGGSPPSSLAILKHVLTWSLWPCFFERFGKYFYLHVLETQKVYLS